MALTKKQKQVLDFIKKYNNTHGVSPTQKEIQEAFALKSLGSVQKYLKYLVNAGLIEIENRSHRGINVIEAPSSNHPAATTPQNSTSYVLPLLGAVAAGNPIEAIENPDNLLEIPPHLVQQDGSDHFILKVSGDSMIEEGINDGDLIICKKSSSAHNGELIVALWEGEATVKRFYRHSGHRIELRPANSAMESFWPTSEDLQIIGRVVGLMRSYD